MENTTEINNTSEKNTKAEINNAVEVNNTTEKCSKGKLEHRRVIIIGSGPAGLTAGIYTARANLKPLILHGGSPGGQLMITTEVENFPGCIASGPDLIYSMEEQAKGCGVDFEYATVTKVEVIEKYNFKVYISNTEYYTTERIIIATGATAKFLGIPSEQKYLNKGVSACATCDGPLFRNKEMAVIGGGDTAAEEALFLTNISPKVHLIHRRDKLRASKVMIDKVKSNEKIEIHWDSEVEEIKGHGYLDTLVIKNNKTGKLTNIELKAVFIAIGHIPQTSLFKGLLEMDSQGYIIAKNRTETSVPGIFVCGDAQDHYYRQAITAAGSGCQAAIDTERSF